MYFSNFYTQYDPKKELAGLPQFANLTEEELEEVVSRIRLYEAEQYRVERDAKLKVERTEDSRYMEEDGKKDPVLPDGDVKIERGILITFATMDKNGFASAEDLAKCKKAWKMSLEHDATKRIYL